MEIRISYADDPMGAELLFKADVESTGCFFLEISIFIDGSRICYEVVRIAPEDVEIASCLIIKGKIRT